MGIPWEVLPPLVSQILDMTPAQFLVDTYMYPMNDQNGLEAMRKFHTPREVSFSSHLDHKRGGGYFSFYTGLVKKPLSHGEVIPPPVSQILDMTPAQFLVDTYISPMNDQNGLKAMRKFHTPDREESFSSHLDHKRGGGYFSFYTGVVKKLPSHGEVIPPPMSQILDMTPAQFLVDTYISPMNDQNGLKAMRKLHTP